MTSFVGASSETKFYAVGIENRVLTHNEAASVRRSVELQKGKRLRRRLDGNRPLATKHRRCDKNRPVADVCPCIDEYIVGRMKRLKQMADLWFIVKIILPEKGVPISITEREDKTIAIVQT